MKIYVDAKTGEMLPGIEETIARHRAAVAALEAARDQPDAITEVLSRAAATALQAVVAAPAREEDEFLKKLRYLFEHEMAVEGGYEFDPFSSVLQSIDLFFKGNPHLGLTEGS
jgi:hypothetical protein